MDPLLNQLEQMKGFDTDGTHIPGLDFADNLTLVAIG
jgi:hypothetical protein